MIKHSFILMKNGSNELWFRYNSTNFMKKADPLHLDRLFSFIFFHRHALSLKTNLRLFWVHRQTYGLPRQQTYHPE